MPEYFITQEWITLSTDSRPYGYIALHGTPQMTALGGCRILKEPHNIAKGRSLSMALAETMQKKSKTAGLPLSGGKTVLFIEHPEERAMILSLYAEALNKLGGRYITAVDIGSSQEDMDFLSRHTQHISCHTKAGGDPSPYTAQTVLNAVLIAYPFLSAHSPNQKHCVIQGLGKVGMELLKLLSNPHFTSLFRITVTDIDDRKINHAQHHYICHAVEASEAYRTPCDIFISAADSHLINETIASTLPCALFAAAANNVFTHQAAENILKSRGVWILPDYLINSGGVIYCALQAGLITDLDHAFSINRAAVLAYVEALARDATE